MPKTILVVDDKANVRHLLEEYLSEQGYRVVLAADGRQALYSARHDPPDLILLDIMMPHMDGYEFIKAHRKQRSTPIVLLTARLEESDKVLGLELGADDYVTKPFSLRELLARIRAVLRRADASQEQPEFLHVQDVILDRTQHHVEAAGQRIDLTPTEFELLATLMAYPGRAYTREELLERLQGQAFEGSLRTIDVHVRNLRAKLEPDLQAPRYIETVFGIGYRFGGED